MLDRRRELTIAEKNAFVRASTIYYDAFGDYWAFLVGHHTEPWARFWSGGKWIGSDGMVAAIFPPYSLVRWKIEPGAHRLFAYLTRQPLHAELPGPVGFVCRHHRLPKNLEELRAFLVEHESRFVPLALTVPASVHLLKEIVDHTFQQQENLVSFYRARGVSYEGVCRAFKKTYGLTPSQYRVHLRLLDVQTQLLWGKSVTEAAFNSGFNNLSLFNRQFKREFGCQPSRILI